MFRPAISRTDNASLTLSWNTELHCSETWLSCFQTSASVYRKSTLRLPLISISRRQVTSTQWRRRMRSRQRGTASCPTISVSTTRSTHSDRPDSQQGSATDRRRLVAVCGRHVWPGERSTTTAPVPGSSRTCGRPRRRLVRSVRRSSRSCSVSGSTRRTRLWRRCRPVLRSSVDDRSPRCTSWWRTSASSTSEPGQRRAESRPATSVCGETAAASCARSRPSTS